MSCSLFYPQSNGKLERYHKSIKSEAIRPKTPLSIEDAKRLVGDYVNEYNTGRLPSSIGYIPPRDKLDGRAEAIFAERDRKLEATRQARAQRRAAAGSAAPNTSPPTPPPPQEPAP